jgi:hypothetical protein
MKCKGHDEAAFPIEDIQAIYGVNVTCVVTRGKPVDFHHILGRGQAFGSRIGTDDRRRFSSMYNCIPLKRDVHDGPVRDSREMRRLFLRIARERVEQATIRSGYQISDHDEQYLELAEKWCQDFPNPC